MRDCSDEFALIDEIATNKAIQRLERRERLRAGTIAIFGDAMLLVVVVTLIH
jgi:hypothetical protein